MCRRESRPFDSEQCALDRFVCLRIHEVVDVPGGIDQDLALRNGTTYHYAATSTQSD